MSLTLTIEVLLCLVPLPSIFFDMFTGLQGDTLYATQDADSHSVFLELSRIFFDGSPELHFANFLHMIKTMAESGTHAEQI